MTDKPHDNKDQPPPDPKRPHATLDLKATELRSEAGKSSAEPAPASGQATNTGPAGGPKTEPRKPAGPSPAQRSPSPFTRLVTHLAAGVVGGAIVLFGGDRLAQWLGTPTPAARVEQLASSFEKRIAALEAAPKSDAYDLLKTSEERLAKIDKLATDFDALRAEQAKLAERTDGLSATLSGPQGPAALAERVAALEDQLKTLSAAASDPGGSRISDIAAVTSRISESESRFSGAVSELRDGIAREIDQRLAVREDTTKADLARLSQTIEKLKADQERIDKSVQAAQEEAARAASGLSELKAGVDQQAKSFAKTDDVAAAVAPVAGMVSRIEDSLQGVLKNEKERQSHTERIVTALELGNLKRAIESGEPFADEFDAVNVASGGRLDLKPLEPYKTKGVPSLASLKDEARPALLAALDASSVDPAASVWDRLLASAKSVVRIRRIDAAEGDQSVEATIARIEKELNEGRLAGVLAEARKLPPEASAKLAPWLEKVAARHGVDEAIATVENELKAALAGAPATAPAGGNE